MAAVAIDPTVKPEWLDGIRYQVSSRTNPHDTYLCELTDYSGNGRCVCRDFQIHFEPHLSRMVGPAEALARGLVEQREYQPTPEDVFKCWHLVQAHWQFERDTIARVLELKLAETGGRDEEGP
jgi:hypothetical protein